MNWYIYQIFGMFAQLGEALIDKTIIVKSTLNDYQTSFLRLSTYTFIIITYLLLSGDTFKILFRFDILLIGILGAFSSFIYSSLVKNHDISILIIVPIILPVFFYIFDYIFLTIPFTFKASLSLFISLIGSYIFLKNHIHIKKKLILSLGFMVFYSLLEFYLFKKSNINPMLFFGNTVLISSITIGIFLIFTKQFTKDLIDISYLKGVFISKNLDVILTICYGYAMLATSGFNFSIFQLIFAPISFLITYLLIKVKALNETYLTINSQMIIGLIILILGEYLMFLSNY